ncbi:MAG: divergent polysaccharide deacetylase family protein [Hyphomicrobiaceae bacterium]|nr:divergent polysaccharide deacetylase family protein [Hyphomicrobiaceae bacterium]
MKALAITTTAILGIIASAIVWFVMRADPMGGEPIAIVQIDPASRPAAEAVAGPVIPDVKAVAPPVVPPPSATTEQQTVPATAFGGTQQPAMRQPETGAATVPENQELVRLPPVPVRAVVETSRYGPLPKIASDGRRPSEVYARPINGSAGSGAGQPARIAVLITGLGLSDIATTQAIDSLPGPVTLAFGPYGRNLDGWVRKARDLGHEVMLQVPLEPFDYPDNDPGPHTLLTSLPAEENLKRLHWIMSRFTGYTGITNHMGAKFAAAQDAFLPVLEELKSRGLIYLDDGTAARSTAGQIARDLGLDYSVSQVVIDEERNAKEIELSLKKLEGIAQEKGLAIGIGSSLPLTIGRVTEWAKQLKAKGIELIPISAAVRSDRQT